MTLLLTGDKHLHLLRRRFRVKASEFEFSEFMKSIILCFHLDLHFLVPALKFRFQQDH